MISVQRIEVMIWRLCLSRRQASALSFIVALLFLLGANLPVTHADQKAKLLTITSQTTDLLVFRVSATKSSYALGEDVVINYAVRNASPKAMYLVSEPKPRVSVDEETLVLTLESPVKYQDDFSAYDNDLIRVLPGKSLSGKLVIKGSEIPRDKASESEDWDLRVGFSYVFDPSKQQISELLDCKDTKYSFPCLGKLVKLSKRLTVGNLVIEVKNH